MSGLRPVLAVSGCLAVISWFLTPHIYALITRWVSALFDGTTELEDSTSVLPGPDTKQQVRTRNPARIWTLCFTIAIAGLWIVRPPVPYNHMSGTLPVVLMQVLIPHHHSYHGDIEQQFPFPDLLESEFWEAPHGHSPGWAPTASHATPETYIRPQPWWSFSRLPRGFERWADPTNFAKSGSDGNKDEATPYYNPVTDPLKISNLDLPVLEPLKQALQDHDIPINHVVFVLLESARKDLFPFKAGSPLHEKILASHDTTDEAVVQKVNEKLSKLTPVAEKLTGQSSGFFAEDSAGKSKLGGIDIEGVSTGSSLSFKSAVMNYCGVQPLPVNFMKEAESDIYQPCIMQILDLFNQMKSDKTDAVHDRKWKSVFLQSITGRYDNQDVLNENMGFNESIYKETLIDSHSRHYHVPMEKINYFGYPEPEIYPYIQDAINDAVENKTRLFLSHFTSTTHHPWGTPNAFEYNDYFSKDSVLGNHQDMNSYLNAIRYVDTWLGEVMKLLDDSGIANETLVVLVGDHGQAFQEDAPISGTYQNPHISNFQIPLVFHHPLLPRMQVTANTTSISILPTILDLLIQTKSLNTQDSDIAFDLLHQYEGQSLIRPYKATHNGRQAWNFNVINPGGEILSVGSAAAPYRLIIPMTGDFEYRFVHREKDPEEVEAITEWEVEMLVEHVRHVYGDGAARWVAEAEKVGRWWIGERWRLWDYDGE
ncbi:hypothetical protein SI65_02092 [Aspergillus cristatus]|uniref:Sulfatase N-terminal domain-containing protein n=1 Tax=Aspergillus cristatus TaxID=573508 RepID=A0A1E3BTC1_ASPCR|nr:hypothetical protein SI65_01788 [Aspergillus cristatus]ODM24502.1 hypothetical protein SI65_02092 [Aspergillus cristatus]